MTDTRADGVKQFRQWRAENPTLVAYPDVCFCAGVLAGREHERKLTAKEIVRKLRMYARGCDTGTASLAYEAAAYEIEKEYGVQP